MQRKQYLLIITSLIILVIGLSFQITNLNSNISELEKELNSCKKEDNLTQTCLNIFEEFLRKTDNKLINNIDASLDGEKNRVFPITISLTEGPNEINQIGIGFISLNDTKIKQGKEYLATGTINSIIKATMNDNLRRIKLGYDTELPIFSSGEILETAFADFPEDAEISVSPESPKKDDLVEITIINKHQTKKMAFILNLYYGEISKSNLVFSSTEAFEEYYQPAYIIIDPRTSYKIQLRLESAGEYVVESGNFSFTVN